MVSNLLAFMLSRLVLGVGIHVGLFGTGSSLEDMTVALYTWLATAPLFGWLILWAWSSSCRDRQRVRPGGINGADHTIVSGENDD